MRRTLSPSGDPGSGDPGRSAKQSGGRFIVLEGIDGSGKTEQARRLGSWLRGLGHSVVETREPTDGRFGRRYRAWAAGELEADAEQVLEFFLEDRREHVRDLIRPALERGDWVVSDRYRASTLAYQAAHGIDRGRLRELFASDEFPEPDLEIWLRLPVATAVERMGAAATERYEKADFLARVEVEYARLDLIDVAATGGPDEVQARLRALVRERLPTGSV